MLRSLWIRHVTAVWSLGPAPVSIASSLSGHPAREALMHRGALLCRGRASDTVRLALHPRRPLQAPSQVSTITQLVAGVPVSNLDTSIDWYGRFFGRPPDMRVGDEVLWDVDEHATLFIEPNAAQAGAGRITLAVTGLDALLEGLAERGIEYEPIETYSNGVRHVKVPDPDGNAIAFAEPPSTG
jgi:catechol 2,3-dioxygenase-like lactoylglutathione lyase family enzyme